MNPRSNCLIKNLTNSEFEILTSSCRLMSFKQGDQLFSPGEEPKYVYFPVNAMISIAKDTINGNSIDMAIVGEEGAVGLRGLFFNNNPYRVYVASSGLAYVIEMDKIKSLSKSGSWVHQIYMQANHQILEQIATEASCMHFHNVYQRVARWLLIRGHRTNSPSIDATHQHIADSLGVRREAVTLALKKLCGIHYCRGQVEIHDFSLLEKETCDCHRPNSNFHLFKDANSLILNGQPHHSSPMCHTH